MTSKELIIIVLAILGAGCIIAGAVFISNTNNIEKSELDNNLTNNSSNIRPNITENISADYSDTNQYSYNQKTENSYSENELGIPEGATQEEVDAYILGADYDAYGSSSGMSKQEYIDYYSQKANSRS